MAESDRPTKLDNFLNNVTICRNTDSCISRIWRTYQRMTDKSHSLRYTSLNDETNDQNLRLKTGTYGKFKDLQADAGTGKTQES